MTASPEQPCLPRRARLALAIAAVVALNLPLGTVYAFSVFLRPLEAELGLSRAALSLVFGLTIIGFTIGMNLGPRLYRLAAPAVLVAAGVGIAAAGLLLAATAGGLVELALGYGMLFGIGGGVAYVLLLQGVNLIWGEARRGLMNGFVVSLYPAGAMIGAPVFGWALGEIGLRATLGGLAATLAVAGGMAALLVLAAGLRLQPAAVAVAAPAGAVLLQALRPVFRRLWLVFFLAAASGLTVLGQAAAIVEAYGGSVGLALGATTAITGCIAAARIGGGWLADRLAVPRVMAGAQALALAGDLLLLALPGPQVAVLALAMIGMGYGIISGSTAAAIGVYWGGGQYGRMAGRLYIAWCVAAVSLPIVAGRLFDLTGGYAVAIMLAAGSNLLGATIALRLPARAPGA
jgi:OFA family oxalate/formate antiporter-like MFS transporter